MRSTGWRTTRIWLMKAMPIGHLTLSETDLQGISDSVDYMCIKINSASRPLHVNSTHHRTCLADFLFKFPCTLAHFGESECLLASGMTRKLYIIPSFLTVLARLLDGKDGEVTPLVRRKTYGIFVQIMKHQDVHRRDGLDHAANMILAGMSDKDRSVRLSAGYAAPISESGIY